MLLFPKLLLLAFLANEIWKKIALCLSSPGKVIRGKEDSIDIKYSLAKSGMLITPYRQYTCAELFPVAVYLKSGSGSSSTSAEV